MEERSGLSVKFCVYANSMHGKLPVGLFLTSVLLLLSSLHSVVAQPSCVLLLQEFGRLPHAFERSVAGVRKSATLRRNNLELHLVSELDFDAKRFDSVGISRSDLEIDKRTRDKQLQTKRIIQCAGAACLSALALYAGWGVLPPQLENFLLASTVGHLTILPVLLNKNRTQKPERIAANLITMLSDLEARNPGENVIGLVVVSPEVLEPLRKELERLAWTQAP